MEAVRNAIFLRIFLFFVPVSCRLHKWRQKCVNLTFVHENRLFPRFLSDGAIPGSTVLCFPLRGVRVSLGVHSGSLAFVRRGSGTGFHRTVVCPVASSGHRGPHPKAAGREWPGIPREACCHLVAENHLPLSFCKEKRDSANRHPMKKVQSRKKSGRFRTHIFAVRPRFSHALSKTVRFCAEKNFRMT